MGGTSKAPTKDELCKQSKHYFERRFIKSKQYAMTGSTEAVEESAITLLGTITRSALLGSTAARKLLDNLQAFTPHESCQLSLLREMLRDHRDIVQERRVTEQEQLEIGSSLRTMV